MCLGTSFVRKQRRLVLGASKKIKIFSAEMGITVGVMGRVFKGTRPTRQRKREKGLKSPSGLRARKRRRGLRKGKKRSRGRQPRSNSFPSQQPSPPPLWGPRRIRTHCRAFDYHELRLPPLKRRVGSWIEQRSDGVIYDLSERFFWALRLWQHNHSAVSSRFCKDAADHILGSSFPFFLEKWFGIQRISGPKNTLFKRGESAQRVLLRWRDDLRARARLRALPKPSPGRKRPAKVLRRGTRYVCEYCGVDCPMPKYHRHCNEPCVSVVTRDRHIPRG